jgi:hypothetical protein
MTKETKGIPLRVALEYMASVNNLLNNLIREDKFPAILFAKYDRTFKQLLKMAQIMNYKFKDSVNVDMEVEAEKFMDNIDRWELQYRDAVDSKQKNLGITRVDDDLPTFDEAKDMVGMDDDVVELEKRVKDVLGRDLFDEVLGRIKSKSREHALSKVMEDMIEGGDLDDEVAN